MENYRAVLLRDCSERDCVYKVIMLNNKHSIDDFQAEINRVTKKPLKEIDVCGDYVESVFKNIDEEFDWFEAKFEYEDYLTI